MAVELGSLTLSRIHRASSTDDKAFFRNDGDWFVGNGVARGPWSEDACHGGPVAGLLARAIERTATDPGKQLARLTVSFRRPVPVSGFRIDAKMERRGRMVIETTATLRDADDRVCALAHGLHLATGRFRALPTASISSPSFEDAIAGEFPGLRGRHDLPYFGHGVEIAYPPGQKDSGGPTTLWMRSLPILEGDTMSPFQTVCPLADSGNGISRNAGLADATFVNPDVTIALHRLPESEWIGSQAISFWQPSGIGMAQAMLFDTVGAIGTALQCLIVRPTS